MMASCGTISRRFSSAQFKVTMFPGDGIGPEITQAVISIHEALKIPIEWEFHKIHSFSQTADGDLISAESLDSVRLNKFALKGPFTTPIGKGFRSLNVTLRKKLQTYANVRPCITIPGVKDLLYHDVDLVTIRENTEGEYSGLEHEVVPGIVENLKIISRTACQNIAEYAFEFAKKQGILNDGLKLGFREAKGDCLSQGRGHDQGGRSFH
jgi:isocitrate dehydrogenase (NAD+)